jgi:hypothetical protein
MLPRQPGQYLFFPSFVLLQEILVRTPNDLHSRAATGLDTGDGVLKHQTLARLDLFFSFLAQIGIDGLERNQVDIRQGLAATLSNPWIIAQDPPGLREDGKNILQMIRLKFEILAV